MQSAKVEGFGASQCYLCYLAMIRTSRSRRCANGGAGDLVCQPDWGGCLWWIVCRWPVLIARLSGVFLAPLSDKAGDVGFGCDGSWVRCAPMSSSFSVNDGSWHVHYEHQHIDMSVQQQRANQHKSQLIAAEFLLVNALDSHVAGCSLFPTVLRPLEVPH